MKALLSHFLNHIDYIDEMKTTSYRSERWAAKSDQQRAELFQLCPFYFYFVVSLKATAVFNWMQQWKGSLRWFFKRKNHFSFAVRRCRCRGRSIKKEDKITYFPFCRLTHTHTDFSLCTLTVCSWSVDFVFGVFFFSGLIRTLQN